MVTCHEAAAVLRPPGSPAEDLDPAGGAAGIADHAAREGVWPAIEPINRCEDDMTNGLEQAVGLGEVIEPVLPGTQAWPMSGSVMGGVVGEAGGAPLDVALVALLLGWPRSVGMGLDRVEAALDELDE
jgi:hypothetical protein